MPELPNDADIQRMLADAAAESERNQGAEEVAARQAMFKERARRSGRLKARFDMVATIALIALVVFLALALHDVFNIG